jgi:F-type H+-transporting ATPase subunit b
MYLITPGLGIIFWQTVSFIFVLLILKKFAWKPILSVIKSREAAMAKATHSLELAISEGEKISLANEEAIKKAAYESDKIIKEALNAKNKILESARYEAEKLGNELLQKAKAEIENEKTLAVSQLRSYLIDNSVRMAEILVKKKLDDNTEQKYLLDRLIDESK